MEFFQSEIEFLRADLYILSLFLVKVLCIINGTEKTLFFNIVRIILVINIVITY